MVLTRGVVINGYEDWVEVAKAHLGQTTNTINSILGAQGFDGDRSPMGMILYATNAIHHRYGNESVLQVCLDLMGLFSWGPLAGVMSVIYAQIIMVYGNKDGLFRHFHHQRGLIECLDRPPLGFNYAIYRN